MFNKKILRSILTLLFCGILTQFIVHQHTYAQEVGLDDGEHLPLWNVNIGADINYSSGNFDQIRANGRGSFLKRWDRQLALVGQLRYQYMKNGETKFSDDFRSVVIANLNPLDNFQPFGLLLYHQSFTRFIDQRWMGGLGVAYSFQRTQTRQFKLGIAAAYEWTTLDGRDPSPFSNDQGGTQCSYLDDPHSLRSCSRQMWRLIPRLASHHEFSDGNLIIDGEALWVIDPLNLKDERVYLSTTIAVPILSWLRVSLHYDLSFESIILHHRTQLDSHISFGLQVTSKGLKDDFK